MSPGNLSPPRRRPLGVPTPSTTREGRRPAGLLDAKGASFHHVDGILRMNNHFGCTCPDPIDRLPSRLRAHVVQLSVMPVRDAARAGPNRPQTEVPARHGHPQSSAIPLDSSLSLIWNGVVRRGLVLASLSGRETLAEPYGIAARRRPRKANDYGGHPRTSSAVFESLFNRL